MRPLLNGQPVAGQRVRRDSVPRTCAVCVCRARTPEENSAWIDVFPGDIGLREQHVESRLDGKGSGDLGTRGIRDQRVFVDHLQTALLTEAVERVRQRLRGDIKTFENLVRSAGQRA